MLPTKQNAEVKNGRLAMIGFSGMLHHALITHKGPIDQIMSADFVSALPLLFMFRPSRSIGRALLFCAERAFEGERARCRDARRGGEEEMRTKERKVAGLAGPR